jgi:hypothetical protein
MRSMRRLAAALLAVAACSSRAAIESCASDLGGTYVADDGERWIVADRGATLEAYPLFPDAPTSIASAGGADLVIAPRVIDLARGGDGVLVGATKRRYMRGRLACESRAAATVARCTADAFELVAADPPPPSAFEPCRFDAPPRTRVARWKRE